VVRILLALHESARVEEIEAAGELDLGQGTF
jgi:hypothetical protein